MHGGSIMKKLSGILLVVLVGISTVFMGCLMDTPDPDPTYFVAMGGISNGAANWENYCDTAEEAYAFVLKYPVYSDQYRSSESGVTRAEIIQTIDSNPVLAPNKAQFLKMLDDGGAVFQELIMQNGDRVYVYVEEE
jgi:hypothetical protein